MDSLKNFFNSLKAPKDQDFYDHGYLTPEQFIVAGDQLTQKGWQWQPSATGKQNKIFKDKNKQFLTSTARSSQRIKDIMQEKTNEVEDNGWIVTNEKESDDTSNRLYNLSITYDEYYKTPRLWLQGSTEDGNPLTDQQIFEDIMNEYQNETVTVMEHPHLGIQQISIHPCKHADVMKLFIQKALENGKKIEPHQALFIFLKFLSSVMPTIEHDATTDVNL